MVIDYGMCCYNSLVYWGVYSMIDWLIWLALGVIILATYLDIKYKAVPSVFLSALVFICLLMRLHNLLFGIILLVFGIMIKDLIHDVAGMDFGNADLKILVVIGLLFASSHVMMWFMIIFAILQFAYTTLWRTFISKEDHIPFIPCLLAIFVTLLLTGGFA